MKSAGDGVLEECEDGGKTIWVEISHPQTAHYSHSGQPRPHLANDTYYCYNLEKSPCPPLTQHGSKDENFKGTCQFPTLFDGFPYLNEHLEQYIMSPNYPDPYPNNYEEVI